MLPEGVLRDKKLAQAFDLTFDGLDVWLILAAEGSDDLALDGAIFGVPGAVAAVDSLDRGAVLVFALKIEDLHADLHPI